MTKVKLQVKCWHAEGITEVYIYGLVLFMGYKYMAYLIYNEYHFQYWRLKLLQTASLVMVTPTRNQLFKYVE